MTASRPPAAPDPSIVTIRDYWERTIHDEAITKHPVGTAGFFRDLEEYRFDKLRYLASFVGFEGYAGKAVLEVGCGVAVDLARFARGGAIVTGIDLSPKAIELARTHFRQQGLSGTFEVMNGEAMTFPGDSFDVVYAHGALQYTRDSERMAREIHRVLKPGGLAILQVYNRRSWLMLLSKVMKVDLEHEDAPGFRVHDVASFRRMLAPFERAELRYERFPVKSRLHRGPKAILYNALFVGLFDALPRSLVRPLGWHLIAKAWK